ncbi:hypothetical protein [Mycobacterium talmoniae]|uniref:Uncharacterized protein n=1 Tax=Mycobacterium talmoniae TaxID=1858794 RepID=A0A1S1NHL9_9MYCO|nr:hypothetical protein [Mycobacterium talmoniae]OHV03473.1 hypothetical protein BKN37_14795 [Mycobacterium talmoniae]
MVKPERRTKVDIAAAVAIAVVVAVAAALIWWTSDARATESRPATAPAAEPTAAREVPATLKLLWSAASPATSRPIVVAGTVITGLGHRVDGRDLATGASRWSYARDADLCAVSYVYHYVLAVYPDRRGCGQVSGIDASTGRRGPARTSYADKHVTVSSNGTTVLSAGRTRLELWRSDLVRMLSYGEIDAPVKPSVKGLGAGCALLSAAAGSSAVSVLEACPGQADLRLTLLRPGKEDDEPEARYVPQPGIAADSGARVLAVSDTRTAVYLPSPKPRVEVVDSDGATVASTLLDKPPAASATTSTAGDLVTWWTGDAVLMFDAGNLSYRYTVHPAGSAVPQGPATIMAGRLLIPVAGGVGVYDPATGDLDRSIPVNRPPSTAAVIPAAAGSTLIEQRGDTVVALG